MNAKIFAAFFFVSTTSLLPSNLFQNAHEYFYYKLRNVTNPCNLTIVGDGNEPQTHLQHIFESHVTFCGGVLNIMGTFLNVLATNSISNATRVIVGHFICLLAFLPTLVLAFINTDTWQIPFFWTSMAFAGLASFGSIGLVGGGIFGLAATFPESYMKAVMLGQAAAGLLSSGLSIFCQAFASDDLVNGRVYFSIAIAWSFVSILAYGYLVKSDLAKEMRQRSGSPMDERGLLDEEDEITTTFVEQTVERPRMADAWRDCFDTVGPELISTALVVGVSLSGFPAIAAEVATESHNEKWQHYFTAVYCFLVFNLGDSIGRLVGGFIDIGRNTMLWLSVSRLIFPLLLTFCNVTPRLHPSLTIFPSDGIFLMIMILYGLSNGIILTIAGVGLSRYVPEELKEVSGSMLALMGATSALIGSLVGVVLVGLI
ncbi:unnamed protein product, partial [Mesorhabditis belari]|uniref:Major facilitator superfamily (MFS) profile domain-containing protein n=1 Tax=Mesorhabditis belari TaxID=2138241 RepID=A0AAF3EZH8_9BILA